MPGVGAYADLLKSPLLPDGEQRLDRWFDTTAFGIPAQFTLGTDSRTQAHLRGPKVKRLDLLVARQQKLGGAVLRLRGEIENVFNTPRFDEPIGNIQSPDFGKVTGGGGERRIQLGVRLAF